MRNEGVTLQRILHLSKNEFLITWGLKSGSYEEKENGQTADFDNLSALAPQLGLEPRTL